MLGMRHHAGEPLYLWDVTPEFLEDRAEPYPR